MEAIETGTGHSYWRISDSSFLLPRLQGSHTMIKPMLLSSGPLRPDSDRYAFEVKWDGLIQRSITLAARAATSVGVRIARQIAPLMKPC